MGFWQRLWAALRGNANSALDRIEDPESSLDVAIEDMTREVAAFRGRVASSLVDQKRLVAEFETSAGKSEEWARRAEAAVRAGDDDLAREALKHQAEHAAVAKASYAATEQHNRIVVQLKDALRDLTQKLDDAKRKRNLLVARVRGAKARKKMAEAMGPRDAGGAFGRFDDLEDKVARLEAESDVSAEMASDLDSTSEAAIERRFRALGDPALEESLRKLKERMLPGSKPQPALGTGEAHDAGEPPGGTRKSR